MTGWKREVALKKKAVRVRMLFADAATNAARMWVDAFGGRVRVTYKRSTANSKATRVVYLEPTPWRDSNRTEPTLCRLSCTCSTNDEVLMPPP